MENALCTYWAILALCAAVKFAKINAAGYLDGSDDKQDSFTSQKLSRISRGLADDTQSLHSSNWKRSDEDALDNFRNAYTRFWNSLNSFAQDFPATLKPNAPPALQYVTLLPSMLSPDDPFYFQTKYVPVILVRYQLIYSLFTFVMKRAKPYIDDAFVDWFDHKTDETMTLLNELSLPLQDLPFTKTSPDFPTGSGLSRDPSVHSELNPDLMRKLDYIITALVDSPTP